MPSDTPKIECRFCGSRLSKVTNTWQIEAKFRGKCKTIIKRRRECLHCRLPFTTIETYESEDIPNHPDFDAAVPHPTLSQARYSSAPPKKSKAPALPPKEQTRKIAANGRGKRINPYRKQAE